MMKTAPSCGDGFDGAILSMNTVVVVGFGGGDVVVVVVVVGTVVVSVTVFVIDEVDDTVRLEVGTEPGAVVGGRSPIIEDLAGASVGVVEVSDADTAHPDTAASTNNIPTTRIRLIKSLHNPLRRVYQSHSNPPWGTTTTWAL